jgi:hypothetical protein
MLTNSLVDLHAVPEIASREVAAMAVGIAGQTVSRVSTPEVRIRMIPSHIDLADNYPAHPKQHHQPMPTA